MRKTELLAVGIICLVLGFLPFGMVILSSAEDQRRYTQAQIATYSGAVLASVGFIFLSYGLFLKEEERVNTNLSWVVQLSRLNGEEKRMECILLHYVH